MPGKCTDPISNTKWIEGTFSSQGQGAFEIHARCTQAGSNGLPFADTRDIDEQRRGLIAPMKDLQDRGDAGHVAWDMERFQFLDNQEDFDSIHPSLLRQSKLNNNYGLYEVVPGIYQVRGFDLSDISFVRGKTGWIVFDPLVIKGASARHGSCSKSTLVRGLPSSA